MSFESEVIICLKLDVASLFAPTFSRKGLYLVEKTVDFAGEKVHMSKKVEVSFLYLPLNSPTSQS